MPFNPTQPNEYIGKQLILNSDRGTEIGTLDGYKFFELDQEIVARKDEKILLHLKKAFIPFSFYCIATSQKNNKIDVKETQSDVKIQKVEHVIHTQSKSYNVNEEEV